MVERFVPHRDGRGDHHGGTVLGTNKYLKIMHCRAFCVKKNLAEIDLIKNLIGKV